MSYIRKPRYLISKKKRRFIGFKKSQVVWYFRGVKQYVITEIEDCYDWAYKGPFMSGKREKYSIYLWTKPLLKIETYNKFARKVWIKNDKTIMRYNQDLWATGEIGHSINYHDGITHTKGEAYWLNMAR